MKINGKSVRGFYLYSPDIKFEQGDFVIEENKIYICNSDIMGESPYNSEHYTLYLGEDVASGEEFINYAMGTGEVLGNKFVSAKSLSYILNSYMSGFNSQGIITNEVVGGEDNQYRIVLDSYFGSDLDTDAVYLEPLDKILVSGPNNGIFKVARSAVSRITGTTASSTDSVILRQYTYEQQGDNQPNIRVQELVDHETGLIRYRYSDSLSNYEPQVDWKCSTLQSTYLSMVNEILAYYSDRLIDLEKTKSYLMSSFRFRDATITLTSNPNENNKYEVVVGPDSGLPYSRGEEFFITIVTRYTETSERNFNINGGSNIVWRLDSTVFNLNDLFRENSTEKYDIRVAGGHILSITKNGDGSEGTLLYFSTDDPDCEVANIYYRASYKSESIKGLPIISNINGSHETQIDLTGIPSDVENIQVSIALAAFKYHWNGNGSSDSEDFQRQSDTVIKVIVPINNGYNNRITQSVYNVGTNGVPEYSTVFGRISFDVKRLGDAALRIVPVVGNNNFAPTPAQKLESGCCIPLFDVTGEVVGSVSALLNGQHWPYSSDEDNYGVITVKEAYAYYV